MEAEGLMSERLLKENCLNCALLSPVTGLNGIPNSQEAAERRAPKPRPKEPAEKDDEATGGSSRHNGSQL